MLLPPKIEALTDTFQNVSLLSFLTQIKAVVRGQILTGLSDPTNRIRASCVSDTQV